MKFHVEVDLDWLDEDLRLDESVEKKLLSLLVEKIEIGFLSEAGKRVADRAEALLKAKTEMLINSVLEKPVVVSNGWANTTKYPSIFDMVETQMTDLYRGKLNNSGKCKEDPLLKTIRGYVDSEVDSMLKTVERKARAIAAEESRQAVNDSELSKALGIVIEHKAK